MCIIPAKRKWKKRNGTTRISWNLKYDEYLRLQETMKLIYVVKLKWKRRKLKNENKFSHWVHCVFVGIISVDENDDNHQHHRHHHHKNSQNKPSVVEMFAVDTKSTPKNLLLRKYFSEFWTKYHCSIITNEHLESRHISKLSFVCRSLSLVQFATLREYEPICLLYFSI